MVYILGLVRYVFWGRGNQDGEGIVCASGSKENTPKLEMIYYRFSTKRGFFFFAVFFLLHTFLVDIRVCPVEITSVRKRKGGAHSVAKKDGVRWVS